MKSKQFFNRMWWLVFVGGAFMLAGLVLALVNPGAELASNLLLFVGTAIALTGYVLILLYDRRHRHDPPEPIDREHL